MQIRLNRKIRTSRLGRLRAHDLRRCDRLPNVALRVIGNVNEEASERGWQFMPADRARRFQISVGKTTDAGCAARECRGQFGKQIVASGARVQFGFESKQLLFV